MSEQFTGERLVPGQVDSDLWNEHISRYAFAASFCTGAGRVVDAGCGTGYGSHFLSPHARSVVGIDASSEAIYYAHTKYGGPKTRFLAGLCEGMPIASGSVDLIVAFEVIEHLSGWPRFLSECKRLLAPGGVLLVSTPNKTDYTEARGAAGPNPFHVHEFELSEFASQLERLFPHVTIFGQNHASSIVFTAPAHLPAAAQFATLPDDLESAAFFLAVCSLQPRSPASNFVYVPEAANMLRERERHIQSITEQLAALEVTHLALGSELERSNAWANELDRQLHESAGRIVTLQAEVERAGAWAASLDGELALRSARIVELQDELRVDQQHSQQALAALESELESRTAWARQRDADLAHCVELLHAAEQTVEERTRWALQAQAALDGYRASLWYKAGRALRLVRPVR